MQSLLEQPVAVHIWQILQLLIEPLLLILHVFETEWVFFGPESEHAVDSSRRVVNQIWLSGSLMGVLIVAQFLLPFHTLEEQLRVCLSGGDAAEVA